MSVEQFLIEFTPGDAPVMDVEPGREPDADEQHPDRSAEHHQQQDQHEHVRDRHGDIDKAQLVLRV